MDQIVGCSRSSLDSAAPSILPAQVQTPKHTIYAFIKLYLNCDMQKRRKYTKRGRDWPYFFKKIWIKQRIRWTGSLV